MNEDACEVSPAAGEARAVTRREALKKGAVVGGTVLWAVPLVQSVGITASSAQAVSPGPEHHHTADHHPVHG